MRARLRLGAAALCCMIAGAWSARAADDTAMAFRVPSLSGGHLSNEDFKGKVVILDVWATWCGPCRLVIPHLQELHSKYSRRGVAVVGLNADRDPGVAVDVEAIKAFLRQYGVTYPIGIMTPPAYIEVSRVMGTSPVEGMTIPTTIVLARDGSVVRRYPGYFTGQEKELEDIISRMIAPEPGTGNER